MKGLNRLWAILLVVPLAAGVVSCAGTKAQLKPETPGQVSSSAATEAQTGAAVSKPDQEKSVAPGTAEALPKKPEAPQVQPKAEKKAEKVSLPPVVGQPAGRPGEVVRPGSRFVLNFDNADLYEVIRVMSEMMKISYVIDPRVKGVVNIHTTGQISTEEVFPIFQGILKLNGATAIKRGNVYEIVPFGEAKKGQHTPSISREIGKTDEERYTIQIIPLKFVPVAEVSKMIKPFLSDGADIVEHPPSNMLIVGDVSPNIQKILNIVELFDIDMFGDMRVHLYPIRNSDVNEIAKEMERIFSSFEVSVKSGRGVGITFTPIARINTLLVVSSIPGIFERVEGWLKELDRLPGMGSQMSVFVYYVQNGKAKDMAEVLKQIYVPSKKAEAKPGSPATSSTSPQPRSVRPAPGQEPAAPAAPSTTGGGGVPEGEINIVVDETTNSLIIRAYQLDYNYILETIKKLDLYPKQALIEVLLAEVTLDDAYQYGLEFSTFGDSFNKGGTNYPYSIGAGGTPFLGLNLNSAANGAATAFTSGLRYAISAADKLNVAIHASASANRLKVLSSPHILASNNKEARIQIGKSQPILTNTYTTTATASVGTGVVEGTIEYKDIGIILTVTPRISDGGLVSLEINVEKSDVNTTALGTLTNVPVFDKKTAKTTLSITEGQTIVIGGLIEESKNTTSSGVPFLSRIPILGALFGYHTYDKAKVETLLMMTPHIISDIDQSNAVSREFQDKVRAIKRELEKRDQDRKN